MRLAMTPDFIAVFGRDKGQLLPNAGGSADDKSFFQ